MFIIIVDLNCNCSLISVPNNGTKMAFCLSNKNRTPNPYILFNPFTSFLSVRFYIYNIYLSLCLCFYLSVFLMQLLRSYGQFVPFTL